MRLLVWICDLIGFYSEKCPFSSPPLFFPLAEHFCVRHLDTCVSLIQTKIPLLPQGPAHIAHPPRRLQLTRCSPGPRGFSPPSSQGVRPRPGEGPAVAAWLSHQLTAGTPALPGSYGWSGGDPGGASLCLQVAVIVTRLPKPTHLHGWPGHPGWVLSPSRRPHEWGASLISSPFSLPEALA